jgi:hypothetical protein
LWQNYPCRELSRFVATSLRGAATLAQDRPHRSLVCGVCGATSLAYRSQELESANFRFWEGLDGQNRKKTESLKKTENRLSLR